MLPDRVSNPGPLTYESGALSIALRGPAKKNYFINLYMVAIVQESEMRIILFITKSY